MGDIIVIISKVYTTQKEHNHSMVDKWICYHRKLGGVFCMGEHLFEKLARDRGITVEEMREIISARIRRGMNDPDPKKRAQWEAIPHEGEIPTPEEWLYYAVNYLIEHGDRDLLRWYPNL